MAADEIAPAGIPRNLDAELEQSRQSAGRLLESLAYKLGATRAARYVKTHSAKEMAVGVERAAGRRPLFALCAALAAGFVLGCVLRRNNR